jgi:hypothetical protein
MHVTYLDESDIYDLLLQPAITFLLAGAVKVYWQRVTKRLIKNVSVVNYLSQSLSHDKACKEAVFADFVDTTCRPYQF